MSSAKRHTCETMSLGRSLEVGGSDDTLATNFENFPTLFFHVFYCHVPTLCGITCSYESSVFLNQMINAAVRECLRSVSIFLSIDTSTFQYCTNVVRYVDCFGVSFVFLCVKMIFS